jgi:hypothetical protein
MKDALAAVDDSQLDRVQAIIRGMTPKERANPAIINGSRKLRIANGSGVTVSEVNQLVDRFFEARKMMSQMAGQMGMPFGRKNNQRKAAKGKNKQAGKKKGRGAKGPTPPKNPLGAGLPGGFPDLSNMPKGLDELPPGLANFDLSKLKFPDRSSHGRIAPARRGLPDGDEVQWWCTTVCCRPSRSPTPTPPLTVAGSFPAWSTRTVTSGWGRRRGLRGGGRRPGRDRRDVGALLLRDAGPRWTPAPSSIARICRRIIRAGRLWPGRSATCLACRSTRGRVAAAGVRGPAGRYGDGWVKLVGDWIDRGVGDLAPLWSDEVLVQAIAARTPGGRVTAHVFGEERCRG